MNDAHDNAATDKEILARLKAESAPAISRRCPRCEAIQTDGPEDKRPRCRNCGCELLGFALVPGQVGAIEYVEGFAFKSLDGADRARCMRCNQIVDAGYEIRAHIAEHRQEDLDAILDRY